MTDNMTSISPCSSNNIDNTIRSRQAKAKQTSMNAFTFTSMPKASKLKIDKVLAYFISIDMIPYSIVEKEGFKMFTKALNPSYELPSRSTLSNNRIPDLFKATKLKVEQILSEVFFSQ